MKKKNPQKANERLAKENKVIFAFPIDKTTKKAIEVRALKQNKQIQQICNEILAEGVRNEINFLQNDDFFNEEK